VLSDHFQLLHDKEDIFGCQLNVLYVHIRPLLLGGRCCDGMDCSPHLQNAQQRDEHAGSDETFRIDYFRLRTGAAKVRQRGFLPSNR
jgi:hypothetical protein